MVAKNSDDWRIHRRQTIHDIDGERSRQRLAADRLRAKRIPTRSVAELENIYSRFYDDRLESPQHASAPSGIRRELLPELERLTKYIALELSRRHTKPSPPTPTPTRAPGPDRDHGSEPCHATTTPTKPLQATSDPSMVRGASQQYQGTSGSKVRARTPPEPTVPPLEPLLQHHVLHHPAGPVPAPPTSSAALSMDQGACQQSRGAANSKIKPGQPPQPTTTPLEPPLQSPPSQQPAEPAAGDPAAAAPPSQGVLYRDAILMAQSVRVQLQALDDWVVGRHRSARTTLGVPISEEGLAKVHFVHVTPLLQVSYDEAGRERWCKGTTQLCVRHREGRERCHRGAYCERLHLVPTHDCTNKGYLTTGICSNYSRCRSRHPWDENAWGGKDTAYQRYIDERGAPVNVSTPGAQPRQHGGNGRQSAR